MTTALLQRAGLCHHTGRSRTMTIGLCILHVLTFCLVGHVWVNAQESASNTTTTVSSNDQCLLQEELTDLKDCRVSAIVSCRNKCGQRVTVRNELISSDQIEQRCACDEFCKIFGNCCVDFEIECLVIANITNGDNLAGLHGMNDYKLKCDVVGGFPNRLNQFLMVSTCPTSWMADETKEACENRNSLQLFDFLPVTHTGSGLHFRNIHCSKCHGLASVVDLWSMSLMCSNVDPASMVTPAGIERSALSNEGCQFFFDSNHASPPRRCQDYESTCHPDCQGNSVHI
jgi:hypothetical protein